MNQRSVSALRKMKTDLDEHPQHKKHPNLHPTLKNTPRYEPPRVSTHRQHRALNITCTHPSPKLLKISEPQVQDYCRSNHLEDAGCLNHPNKRGVFEQRSAPSHLYCHECAIRMVKMNIDLITITPHSLILKSFLEQQLLKLAQEEAKVRQVVEDYYLSMRTMFTAFYQEAHARENNSTVLFGDYQINEHVGKIVEHLGKIEEIQIRFTGEEKKEERRDERKENKNQQNQKHREGEPSRKQNKDKSMDLGMDSNRSIDHLHPNRNHSYIARSRENSFHIKPDKAEPRRAHLR